MQGAGNPLTGIDGIFVGFGANLTVAPPTLPPPPPLPPPEHDEQDMIQRNTALLKTPS